MQQNGQYEYLDGRADTKHDSMLSQEIQVVFIAFPFSLGMPKFITESRITFDYIKNCYGELSFKLMWTKRNATNWDLIVYRIENMAFQVEKFQLEFVTIPVDLNIIMACPAGKKWWAFKKGMHSNTDMIISDKRGFSFVVVAGISVWPGVMDLVKKPTVTHCLDLKVK